MIVEIILIIAVLYLAIGVLFVIPFLVRGISKVDEDAHGGTTGFKIIIIPGVIVFWPVLLKKWLRVKNNNPTETQSSQSIS